MSKWQLDNTVNAIKIDGATRGGLSTAGISVLTVAIVVATIFFSIPKHYSPVATIDERGRVHELTYAGKPVRMLTASEVPMDNDGGNETVSVQ